MKKLIFLVALMLVCMFMLAGCGGETEEILTPP